MNILNKRLISGLAAAILAGIYSQAAFAADATGNASATVLAPLTITEDTPMDFGSVSGDTASATTVILTTAGATSSADGAFTDNTGQEGIFDVTGAPGAAYNITLPASATLTGPGADMTVDSFNHDRGATPTLTGGADTISIGATLNINPAQLAGGYTGTYTVTVEYQ